MSAPEAEPAYFDVGFAADPVLASGYVLDTLVNSAAGSPWWVLDGLPDLPVQVRLLKHELHSAQFELTAGGVIGHLGLRIHTSGWIEIRAQWEGRESFLGYLDRPYEEFEIWPAGAAVSTPRAAEAPGRIGKRRNWINLAAAAWPSLQPLANAHGWVVLKADE